VDPGVNLHVVVEIDVPDPVGNRSPVAYIYDCNICQRRFSVLLHTPLNDFLKVGIYCRFSKEYGHDLFFVTKFCSTVLSPYLHFNYKCIGSNNCFRLKMCGKGRDSAQLACQSGLVSAQQNRIISCVTSDELNLMELPGSSIIWIYLR
jgi:hypothetical protein